MDWCNEKCFEQKLSWANSESDNGVSLLWHWKLQSCIFTINMSLVLIMIVNNDFNFLKKSRKLSGEILKTLLVWHHHVCFLWCISRVFEEYFIWTDLELYFTLRDWSFTKLIQYFTRWSISYTRFVSQL